jgi:histone deacetylase 1/2
MKPHRIRMTHNLLLNYGLYRKMEIYVSLEFRDDVPLLRVSMALVDLVTEKILKLNSAKKCNCLHTMISSNS